MYVYIYMIKNDLQDVGFDLLLAYFVHEWDVANEDEGFISVVPIVPYSQLTPCAKWTYNVHNDRTYESRNSKTRNDFLFRYETFLLTLS